LSNAEQPFGDDTCVGRELAPSKNADATLKSQRDFTFFPFWDWGVGTALDSVSREILQKLDEEVLWYTGTILR
jgi:hypothetical protein